MGEVIDFPTPKPPGTPRGLGKRGREMWRWVWSTHAPWLDPAVDRETVRQLCELADERETLRERLSTDADYPPPPDEWRERVALRAVEARIDGLMAALGLAPAWRQQMGGQTATTSRVDKMKARRGQIGTGRAEGQH